MKNNLLYKIYDYSLAVIPGEGIAAFFAWENIQEWGVLSFKTLIVSIIAAAGSVLGRWLMKKVLK